MCVCVCSNAENMQRWQKHWEEKSLCVLFFPLFCVLYTCQRAPLTYKTTQLSTHLGSAVFSWQTSTLMLHTLNHTETLNLSTSYIERILILRWQLTNCERTIYTVLVTYSMKTEMVEGPEKICNYYFKCWSILLLHPASHTSHCLNINHSVLKQT